MHRVAGIGLIALDIVIDDDAGARLASNAGGSCGNVMALLAWFGWDAAPIARLGDDPNANVVRADLSRWGVDDRWMSLGKAAPTPVYIERLRRRADGTVAHRFDRFCLECGGRLPRYQPVTRSAIEPVIDELREWDAIYIDRPSAGAVRLAEAAHAFGLLVVFEPSARGDERHLAQIAEHADVIKYSGDSLTQADRAAIGHAKPTLEIETLGADGLRYRTRTTWEHIEASVVEVRDTAGAGDWTTASLLHHMAELGQHLEDLDDTEVAELLNQAQRLGAWSCQFAGPRGAMERHTPDQALAASGQLSEPQTDQNIGDLANSSDITAVWACVGCR